MRNRGVWLALLLLIVGSSRSLCVAAAAASSPPAATAEIPGVEQFSGIVGLYVAVVDPEADGYRELDVRRYGEDRAFPLASTFKLFVLLEVMQAIDRGDLGWSQRLPIAPDARSLDGGRPPAQMPVRRLARRMIRDSHNTSTDVLYKAVGLERPSARLGTVGLPDIRVTLPTREFWVALGGLAPAVFPYEDLLAAASDYAAADRAEQLRRIEAVVGAGRGLTVDRIDRATEDFYDFGRWSREEAFAILDDLDNAARPDDLVRFVHHLFLDNGLTASSDARMRRLLAKGDRAVDRRAIRVPLSYWGGKGGSDLGMGSMAGYGVTRSGRHVLYAALGAHMRQENADWRILEELLGWAFDELA